MTLLQIVFLVINVIIFLSLIISLVLFILGAIGIIRSLVNPEFRKKWLKKSIFAIFLILIPATLYIAVNIIYSFYSTPILGPF